MRDMRDALRWSAGIAYPKHMRVRVLYFGMLKDAIGRQIHNINLSDGATLGGFSQKIVTVKILALNGDEKRTRFNAPRVGADALDQRDMLRKRRELPCANGTLDVLD